MGGVHGRLPRCRNALTLAHHYTDERVCGNVVLRSECFIVCNVGASLVAQLVRNLPAVQETWVQLLSQEDPLEEKMATYSRIFAWKIPRTEEPAGCKLWGHKESDTTE